jgi:hypothetical protein
VQAATLDLAPRRSLVARNPRYTCVWREVNIILGQKEGGGRKKPVVLDARFQIPHIKVMNSISFQPSKN